MINYTPIRVVPADPRWPDALLTVHIDQEWQVPVSCISYADPQGTSLLGRYLYTNVSFNVGLKSDDFSAESYGL